MAIDWRILMMAVPWDEVIKNAPKVADGARKLWGSITRKPIEPEQQAHEKEFVPSSESQNIAKLETQLAMAEEKLSELHGQMVASARLITELADQNTQLVAKAEVLQRQIRWLAVVSAMLLALSVTSLCLAFLH